MISLSLYLQNGLFLFFFFFFANVVMAIGFTIREVFVRGRLLNNMYVYN
jgi:hypothetical protein